MKATTMHGAGDRGRRPLPTKKPPARPAPLELATLTMDLRASAQTLTDRGLSVTFVRGRRGQVAADVFNGFGSKLYHASTEGEFHAYAAGVLACAYFGDNPSGAVCLAGIVSTA